MNSTGNVMSWNATVTEKKMIPIPTRFMALKRNPAISRNGANPDAKFTMGKIR
ncbi:hypothetical protein D3C74_416150 [compost metagenome]